MVLLSPSLAAAGKDHDRLPGLEAVRAGAIAVVMAFHLNIPGFFNAGFLGVDVFFGLSGFLITSLLLGEYAKTGRIDLQRFYLRRFARLVPAVTLLLLVGAVLTPILMPQSTHRLYQDWFWASVYASNWWQIVSEQSYFANFGNPPLLRHLWSLAVEMQFYLLWPLLLLGALRLAGVRAVLGMSGLLALASTALMAWSFYQTPTNPNRAYLGTDTHSMGLFVGASMACWWSPLHKVGLWPEFERLKTIWISIGGSLALGLLVFLLWSWNDAKALLYQGGFFLAACLSVLVLVAAARLVPPGVGQKRGWSIVRWLGSRSYSMYLWHWPVFVYFKGEEPPTGAWAIILCLAWTFLAAEISYRWVEKPINAWHIAGLPRVILAWAVITAAFTAVVSTHSIAPQNTQVDVPRLPVLPAVTPTEHATLAKPDAPTSEPPPAPLHNARILAIGDSVMLGARNRLLRSLPGVNVDAEVGRQASHSVGLVQRYLEESNQVDRAVIHLGTNGYIQESDLRRLLKQLREIDRVVLINVSANRRWTEANNTIIARVAPEYENVRVVDWNDAGAHNPQYFVRDGIHLTDDGITAFVREIGAGLGMELAVLQARSKVPARKKTKVTETGLAAPTASAMENDAVDTKPALPIAPPPSGDGTAAAQPPRTPEKEQ